MNPAPTAPGSKQSATKGGMSRGLGLGCAGVCGLLVSLGTLGAYLYFAKDATQGSPAASAKVSRAAKPSLKGAKSLTTCEKLVACCELLAKKNGSAEVVQKSCTGYLDLPEYACAQNLEAYRASAKALRVHCD